jgi:3-phenylpropionate/trans-cinnamate dioxygenase ferredoxin reductase component
MPSYDYLLLGGGPACAYAAVQIRETDKTGSVAILGAENEPPYDRPPFTKYYLWNDEKAVDDFHSKDESYYPENNIELILDKRAVAIDRDAKTVRTEDGEYGYGKLLYALGSEPKRIPVPGADSAWVLRTAEDSTRIRLAAGKNARAVLIGGGYIGAELSASLIGRGCQVTLVEHNDRVWPNFPSKEASRRITAELERIGVRFAPAERIVEIEGGKRAKAESGKTYEGDFIVMGVGVEPRVELAKNCGLAAGPNGVEADAGLRTADPNIWAAGDVVHYPDRNLGGPYRAEHHLHAKYTAQHCGKAMAGDPQEFAEPPYFFSDVGDLSMNLRGFPGHAARSIVVPNEQEDVLTEVFLFGDGRIAGIVDVRKDYKKQDPIMELFGDLIQKRAKAAGLEMEMSQPGFDVLRLGELAAR